MSSNSTTAPIPFDPIPLDNPSFQLISEARKMSNWKVGLDRTLTDKGLRRFTINITVVRNRHYQIPEGIDELDKFWMDYVDAKTVILESLEPGWMTFVSGFIGEDEEEEVPRDLFSLVSEINKAIKAVAVSLFSGSISFWF
jgi:hypothetical protein